MRYMLFQTETNNIQIGIHIADVSSYIPADSLLDKELKKRCESVYLPTDVNKQTQVNMLPPKLVEKCSLIMSTVKRSFTVVITLNDNKIVDVKFVRTLINVKKNLSYDEAEHMIDNELKLMYEIGKIFNKSSSYDIHEMVAAYMILANSLVAEHLPNHALVRKHKGQRQELEIDTTEVDPKLITYANLLMTEAAEYQIGKQNAEHAGLAKKVYTTFTSPIRRYADIIIHRMLADSTYKIDETYVSNLNTVHKNYNKNERNSIIIYKMFNLVKNNEVHEFDGHVVMINNETKKIRVLIDTDILNNFDLETRIIDKKLDHLVEYELNDNKISIKGNNNIVQFYLFQKIRLKLVFVMKYKKKVIAKIINQDINKLFLNQNDVSL